MWNYIAPAAYKLLQNIFHSLFLSLIGSSHSKRSSINRPVLQLQVKPDTLECIRRRTGSVGIHVVPKDALCSIARDSGIYGKPACIMLT